MSARLGMWRYVIAFLGGITFSVVAWAVMRALGDASWSITVDWAVGLIGIAFAFSLLTGVNLGIQSSIRNVGGDAGALVNPVAGWCLLLFSLAVLFVGPFLTALFQ